jgi:hypothetical protein
LPDLTAEWQRRWPYWHWSGCAQSVSLVAALFNLIECADRDTILGHSSGSNNQGNSNGASSYNLLGKVVSPFLSSLPCTR